MTDLTRRPVLTLVASALFLLVTACRPPGGELDLAVERGPAGIAATYSGFDGAKVGLLVGRRWTGREQLVGMGPGVHVVVPPGTSLQARPLATDRSRTERLGPKALQRHGDATVVQAVAFGSDDTADVVAVSAALSVADGEAVDGGRLGLVIVAVALTLWAGWWVRRRGPQWLARVPPRNAGFAGWFAVVVLVVAALALRIAATPLRALVERGFEAPPLTWPDTWDRDLDGRDIALGPGFNRLLEAARAERDEGEPVAVVAPADGLGMVRGLHLSQALGVEVTPRVAGVAPEGLVVWVGGAPDGEVLLTTGAGSLARGGASR